MTQLELTVLGWFAEWIGYPADASGVLVSGGSAANLTALACARERLAGAMRDDLVVYVSAQSHSSMARAARALGFRPERVRVIPVDRAFRLRVDVLERAVAADRAAGLRPLVVCANAGTTNTGAVDPLPELADAVRRARLLAARGRRLRRLRRPDGARPRGARGHRAAPTPSRSIRTSGCSSRSSAAPSWCATPTACACRSRSSRTTCATSRADGEVNFSDRGLQLSRMCRALKVWMSIQTFGRHGVPRRRRPGARPGA